MTNHDPAPGGVVAGEPVVDTGQQSTSDEAREQATATKDEARQQAREAAGTAKDEAGRVADEAKTQARNVVEEARRVGLARAEEQTDHVSAALRQFHEQAQALLDGRPDDAGVVGDYARQLADAVGRYADRVESLGFEGVIRETTRYARRRPGAFLLMAAGAGLVVGRMGRGVKDSQGDGGTGSAVDTEQVEALPPTTPAPDVRPQQVPPPVTEPSPATEPSTRPRAVPGTPRQEGI